MGASLRRVWLVATTLALWAAPAIASPTFPGAIRDALDLPCRPECTICHRDLQGGYGTVVQKFGKAMISEGGLVPKRPQAIPGALEALAAADSDVDGDGISDVEELRVLEDPNVAEEGAQVECLPERSSSGGCRATRGGADGTAVLAIALGVCALVIRRRCSR